VPAMALNKVTMITVAPVPICANNGPGHAPVMAHPNPKINPPIIFPLLNFFDTNSIGSPYMVLI